MRTKIEKYCAIRGPVSLKKNSYIYYARIVNLKINGYLSQRVQNEVKPFVYEDISLYQQRS
jgi:hypothetical protein